MSRTASPDVDPRKRENKNSNSTPTGCSSASAVFVSPTMTADCGLEFHLPEECNLTDLCDHKGDRERGNLPAPSDDDASGSDSSDSGSGDDNGEDCPVELAECLVGVYQTEANRRLVNGTAQRRLSRLLCSRLREGSRHSTLRKLIKSFNGGNFGTQKCDETRLYLHANPVASEV